jgi:sulfonate transport system substrate-binding protein
MSAKTWRAVGLGLALLVAAAGETRAAEPVNIRVGWAVVPAQLTSIIFTKKELLQHYGKSYTVETVRFRGSAPQITALAAGELDIAALAFSSYGLAIQNAHMEDLRLIGDLYQDGTNGHYSSEYVVRADSDIHKVEDLKGKILASNGIGGAIDMAMRKMLRDHGLEERRDYQIVEVQFPNMIAALDEKKVDLALKDAMGDTQTTLMAARAPYIAAHRAALVDFFEDWQRALRWFYDPKNRTEALSIIADFTKQPASSFSDWVFTKQDYYQDPHVRPNVKALQHDLDVQKELGLLKISIDVKKYSDLSLVDDAAKRSH